LARRFKSQQFRASVFREYTRALAPSGESVSVVHFVKLKQKYPQPSAGIPSPMSMTKMTLGSRGGRERTQKTLRRDRCTTMQRRLDK